TPRQRDVVETLPQMHNAPVAARALEDELVLLEELCETMKFGSLCALGGFTPFPVMSALRHWPADFGARVPEAAE
ncbi:MAG TPA: NADH-ubiquinone oxidoreductase-F iron-sulfur binding region domain-containing protein, partial [Sphingobium sp.]|nr:NADH-ubiquinone oxidoreductase-F iron-sulfur binding region domain-containing protein [Sphingobium sp.]